MTVQLREKTFEKVGGLQDHIQTLREMIIYPLMYKEFFESYGIEAPRGVLFHGPPGTGKTLVAGAVATECSRCFNRRVAFYMRKGADCLNKYVGESEKHLQNLFTQAQNTRPSIIFFDEIDGLVPTRSESQEQVHASIVSTLLALMDGLDSKSEVFVIGATNRIDMIDPALRRPGRFDRELYFPLPPLESRLQIFHIHTKHWKFKPDSEVLLKLASECSGYCGADIQSLCSQAVMESFRRSYPQVTDAAKKVNINVRNVQVTNEDFWAAKEKIIPASQRIFAVPARPLTPELEPLLKRSLDFCLNFIRVSCPFKFIHRDVLEFTKNKSITCPRVLITKNGDQGHVPYLAGAILHTFDHLPVTVIDLPTINDQNVRGSDSNLIVQKIKEARQSMPGIIFFPDIGSWWELIDETGRMVLIKSLEKLDSSTTIQLFLLASSNNVNYDDLPPDVRKIFPKTKSIAVSGPTEEEKNNFFLKLLQKNWRQPFCSPKQEKSSEPELDSDDHWRNPSKRRRSRRQKGLDVEYLGIAFESKPKLGSYYRKYVDDKAIFLKNPNLSQNSECDIQNLTKLNLPYKRQPETSSWDQGPNKKPKTEVRDSPTSTFTGDDLSTKRSKLDYSNGYQAKIEELAQMCVRKTGSSTTESVIKLYEQLEIIMLRFSTTWDQSHLLQELEREITFFNPS